MSVVNCKVAFIRPKYNNLKEWMEDPNNCYIEENRRVNIDGIGYPKKSSIFKIPAYIKRQRDLDKGVMLNMYHDYIMDKISKDEEFKNELLNLRGKNLGCWCKPDICHGDVLMKILEFLN